MDEFQTVTNGKPSNASTAANAKLTARKVELAQVETEIEKLLDTLIGANAVLMSYANNKIEELDAKRQSLIKAIAEMTAGAISPDKLNQISGYLSKWDSIDIAEKRFAIDGLLDKVNITSESARLEWKF